MEVLVTGGNGLLGRELSRELVEDNSVTALVHSPVHDGIPGVHYVVCDLSRRLDISQLPERIDVVVHLAQSSRFRDFPGGARDTFDVNTSATLDLLDYCRTAGGRHFIFASTGGVYDGHDGPITEAGELIPSSRIGFYFASKLAAEMLASTYRPFFDVTVLRIFFMYGPRQRKDMFLPRLISLIEDEQPIAVDQRGGIRVNPILVSDAAHLVMRIMCASPPPVINVAGPDVVTIREIAEQIGGEIGKQPRFETRENSGDIVADISTMTELISVDSLTSFKEGLRSMISSIRTS